MSQVIVYTDPTAGVAVCIPTGEIPIEQVLTKDVPAGLDPEIVDSSSLPSDNVFRSAWVKSGAVVTEDLAKSKVIAHEIRREKRKVEFTPYDQIIASRIPGVSEENAEAARAEIRSRYASIQNDIDASTNTASLKAKVLSI